MIDFVKPYADLYAKMNILSPFDATGPQSVFLLKGEDCDGLSITARYLAARLAGIPDADALNDFADIIVYPKQYVERIEAPQKKSKKKTDAAVTPTLSQDEIDELFETKDLTPFDLERKVYIIENADSIRVNIQNKLLKTLEEPPKSACFILCATGSLLPTIESRCSVLTLKPFPQSVTLENMQKVHPEQKREKIELCCRSGRGYFGIAERNLLDETFLSDYDDAINIIRKAVGSVAFATVSAIYEKYDRKKVVRVLTIMQYLFVDIAKRLAGSNTIYSPSDIDAIKDGFTPQSASESSKFALLGVKRAYANALPVAVMDMVVLKTMEVKALCKRLSA